MAGIDWFRWHHGSVTDPKFQLVAKKAGCTVAEAIAFWAFILESASQAAVRGDVFIDIEAVECLLGLEDGKGSVIYSAMKARGLVSEDNRVTSWEKRQPKREREREDDSAERVAEYRKRQKQEESASSNQEEPKEQSNADVTPSNANVTQKTPRVEKRREELKNIAPSRFNFFKALVDSGVDDSVANDYITARKAKKCVQTETAFRQLSSEIAKSGMPFADAVLLCCRKGWGGFEASWIKDEDRRKHATPGDPNEIITLPDGRKITKASQAFMQRMMA